MDVKVVDLYVLDQYIIVKYLMEIKTYAFKIVMEINVII
jgi:hypothetical protein